MLVYFTSNTQVCQKKSNTQVNMTLLHFMILTLISKNRLKLDHVINCIQFSLRHVENPNSIPKVVGTIFLTIPTTPLIELN